MNGILGRFLPTPEQGVLAGNGRLSLVTIPAPPDRPRLEENVGAANVVLDAADLAEIAAALSRIKIEGDRYPPALQANIDR